MGAPRGEGDTIQPLTGRGVQFLPMYSKRTALTGSSVVERLLGSHRFGNPVPCMPDTLELILRDP